jgi:Subtilase family
MASPLQIILNDRDYQQTRDAGGGGPKKDFFAHRDREFRDHKAALTAQLSTITRTLESQTQTRGDIGYIKVILRRDAWAKSHRPLSALFKSTRIALVGGGDLGEMYFEARPRALRAIAQDIAAAEEQTRLKLDKARNKMVPNPSPARSETGAIEKIELYGPRDRRSFSVEEAITWLARPMTGSAYHIELFDMPPPHSQLDAYDPNRQKLYSTFLEGLAALGDGLTVQRLPMRDRLQPFISARLERSARPPTLLLDSPAPPERRRPTDVAPFDQTIERHRRLLLFLDHHPLVRHIDLPPVVVRTIDGIEVSAQAAAAEGRAQPEEFTLPTRNSTRTYPRMGVIDGGISPELADWVIDRWDLLDSADADLAHGTFIGGLAVAGNALNGNGICAEADGAEIVDVAVYPDDQNAVAFASYFPHGVSQFFEEIEYAIADAKARHGVRVFNMSLNIQHPAQPDRYSQFASRMDQIAEANDAVLFLPTGNTAPQDLRPEWPADETQALVNLASARNDALLMPAESVRNVAVAALNPPDVPTSLAYAPTRYSRRGPGLRAGVKPDLAHVGGSGSPQSPSGHGLFSIRPDGSISDGCGTSYATPIAAKTAAVLEHSIEGSVSRETLICLLLHHAQMPTLLQSKTLRGIARDLVGFGKPPSAIEILEGDDHQITLVFASRLRRDQQIAFNFAWPASLVDPDGACRGSARLTLVSTPPLDPRFGSEFVRINIDAALQQEDFDKEDKLHWKRRLDPIYLPGKAESPVIEAERIEHGLKWSPVKAFARTIPNGIGKSSNWRLFVEYLTRAGEQVPENGVPFTAILTISDPMGEQPIFTDMRQSLQALGVRIEDIRTAARIATRI